MKSYRKTFPARNIPATINLVQEIQNYFLFKKNMGKNHYQNSTDIQRFLKGSPSCSSKTKFHLPEDKAKDNRNNRPANKNLTANNANDSKAELQSINQEIHSCRLCSLSNIRQGIVPGSGGTNPQLMIIGDWSLQTTPFTPDIFFGQQEDEMLWKMIKAIGLRKESVYISNCVKCCPMISEPPDSNAARQCFLYLEKEIIALKPAIICAMGETVARLLLNSKEPFIRLRGRFHSLKSNLGSSVKVMPTYHPRFLLEHPEMKQATWRDLQAIQQQLSKNK